MDISLFMIVTRLLIDSLVSHNLLTNVIVDLAVRDIGNLSTSLTATNVNVAEGIKIRIYSGPSLESAKVTVIPINQPDIIYQNINNSKPLSMFIHGYQEVPVLASVDIIVRAYVDRGTDNIIYVDWTELEDDNYFDSVSLVKKMAREIANTLDKLVDLGLNLDTFHLVGHSLGAQTAGLVGKLSKYTLPRVTGLDAAGPGFYMPSAEFIDYQSAKLVDILHTDAGFYGTSEVAGTADFFPDGGTRPQPNCPIVFAIPLTRTDYCHHIKALQIWANVVRNPYLYPAVQCSSYLEYLLGYCDNNDLVYFGLHTSTSARGTYYLTTMNEKKK